MAQKFYLTPQQVEFYKTNGYLLDLPIVFNEHEVAKHNEGLKELQKLLLPGEDSKEIREWHEESLWLWQICTNPTILDAVEGLCYCNIGEILHDKVYKLISGILGPNFFLWASNFFIKAPRTKDTVGWHQDVSTP